MCGGAAGRSSVCEDAVTSPLQPHLSRFRWAFTLPVAEVSGRSHDCGLARSACIDGENGLSSLCSHVCDGKRLCQPMLWDMCFRDFFVTMIDVCVLRMLSRITAVHRSHTHFVVHIDCDDSQLNVVRLVGTRLLTIKYPHDDSSPRTCKYISELSHHTLTNPRCADRRWFSVQVMQNGP